MKAYRWIMHLFKRSWIRVAKNTKELLYLWLNSFTTSSLIETMFLPILVHKELPWKFTWIMFVKLRWTSSIMMTREDSCSSYSSNCNRISVLLIFQRLVSCQEELTRVLIYMTPCRLQLFPPRMIIPWGKLRGKMIISWTRFSTTLMYLTLISRDSAHKYNFLRYESR